MSFQDSMTTFAEVSVAVLGFSGIVVALVQSRANHQLDAFRFWNLSVAGIGALVGSLTPLATQIIAPGASLSLAAPVLVALLGYHLLEGTRRIHRVGRLWTFLPLSIVVANVFAIGLLSYAYVSKTDLIETAYVIGIMFFLLMALRHFITLIQTFWQQASETDEDA